MIRNSILWVITIGFFLFLLEIALSALLLHFYRYELLKFENEISRFSVINVFRQVATRYRLEELSVSEELYRKETKPSTFNVPDDLLGYKSLPGKYVRTYQKKKLIDTKWESLKVNVTINRDGSRWTGPASSTNEDSPSVYIFGDSFVFGIGVNDEHTFSYLTQQALRDINVKLFALGGYSLTQAMLNFNRLKDDIEANDMIVLGYADFYNARHVLSPSHLRSKREWFAKRNPKMLERNLLLPKVSVNEDGSIDVSYMRENCSLNNGYCNQGDPSQDEMLNITASLVNYVVSNTKAKVFLLHIGGPRDDRLFGMLDQKVTVVHATESDFDHFVRDDIEGFDRHPGPYWHYSISRKLIETLEASM